MTEVVAVKPDRSKPGLPWSEHSFWLWVLLTFLWIAANSSFAMDSVAFGVVISAVLAFIFTRNASVWQGVRFSPTRLYNFVLYTGVFAAELLRANINMMRYVFSPRIDIKPGIVKVKTRLKSPLGRLVLANSIALTPGSLVVHIEGDTLFVHWLDIRTADPDETTRIIVGPFEAYLEKVFG